MITISNTQHNWSRLVANSSAAPQIQHVMRYVRRNDAFIMISHNFGLQSIDVISHKIFAALFG